MFILCFIFAFQKFSKFSALLMERPGNRFAVAKICKKRVKHKKKI